MNENQATKIHMMQKIRPKIHNTGYVLKRSQSLSQNDMSVYLRVDSNMDISVVMANLIVVHNISNCK